MWRAPTALAELCRSVHHTRRRWNPRHWELRPWFGRDRTLWTACEGEWMEAKYAISSLQRLDRGVSVPRTPWVLVGGNAAFIYTAEKLERKKYALLGIEKKYDFVNIKRKTSSLSLVVESKNNLLRVSRASRVKHWSFPKPSQRKLWRSFHCPVNVGRERVGQMACWGSPHAL